MDIAEIIKKNLEVSKSRRYLGPLDFMIEEYGVLFGDRVFVVWKEQNMENGEPPKFIYFLDKCNPAWYSLKSEDPKWLQERYGNYHDKYTEEQYICVSDNFQYLKKVIIQAYESEHREVPKIESEQELSYMFYHNVYTNGKWYIKPDTNTCEFARVRRRISYRLTNNSWIEKIPLVVRINSHSEKYSGVNFYVY